MSEICRVCKRTRVTVALYEAKFHNAYDQVILDTFLCAKCKEAFEWGTAYPEDDAGGNYVEFELREDVRKDRHELDEWHAYRNALAYALSGVAGESRSICVHAANVVIDRHILPPVGELRKVYRDCGLFAAMYVGIELNDFKLEKNEKLSMEDFVNILLNSDVEMLRATYGYRKTDE